MDFLSLSLQNMISVSFLFFILLFLFFVWPNNKWHSLSMSEIGLRHKITISITLLITILISVLPMSLSPYWNGTLKASSDKQQYDRMGDALLQGRLYIDNGDIDPALDAMENPYNKEERDRLGVVYHWDEAYYNHHYYMYFGVVPTLLLFIPYKLFTGNALLSYQATQFFSALIIIGFFYLFYILSRRFFRNFPFSLYLLFSSAFSILSISYSIAAPALYCTAIVSGVCLMVWSIICFLKSSWIEMDKKISGLYLFLGAFLGALAFGCRPPVALANIIIIAVLYQILRVQNNTVKGKCVKVVLLFSPYLIIGVMLMLYNYARFDNIFEFGQSYQLTITDQHKYGNFSDRFDFIALLISLFINFYLVRGFSEKFPFLQPGGVFVNFPILLSSFLISSKSIAIRLRKKGLYYITRLLFFIPIIITLFDAYWAPVLLERYHLDFYYILCIVSFINIATFHENVLEKRKEWLFCFFTILSFSVFIIVFLFFCIPIDGSYTDFYPDVLDSIYEGLLFGL